MPARRGGRPAGRRPRRRRCRRSRKTFERLECGQRGRDRHENFGAGQIDQDVLVEVVRLAKAPVVCETPGGVEGQAADIAFLRDRVPR